jgi:hypothetical protein
VINSAFGVGSGMNAVTVPFFAFPILMPRIQPDDEHRRSANTCMKEFHDASRAISTRA